MTNTKTKKFLLRLDEADFKMIKQFAKEDDRSANSFILRIIKKELSRLSKEQAKEQK